MHKGLFHPVRLSVGIFYCEVLRWLRENVRCKRPEVWKNGDWLLHRDNVPAHTSLVVRELLTNSNMTTVPHPAYWPGLAPTISACSLKWNSGWKGDVSYPLKRSKRNQTRTKHANGGRLQWVLPKMAKIAGIVVYKSKVTTSEVTVEIRT